jgi:peptidoglycan/LPS O-acetylase OafA/YrhL
MTRPVDPTTPDRPLTQTGGLRYRADLDGLRGVAVICVVLYHANVAAFRGGYVGVDVFFVISGYLITMLLTGPVTGTVWSQLKIFYLRRARRILPALLVTSAVSAAAAPLLLLPWDLREFGKFLAASVVQLANLAAWSHGNYFNTAGQVLFEHLWSIAVEEQFYITYPLLLLLLLRQPQRRLSALAAVAAVSFAACVWGSVYKPASNFFLPPSRAWELLLGAVVALAEPGLRLPQEARQLLAGVAALVLAVSVWACGVWQIPYPGVATLAPCLATAALIVTGAGRETAVARCLRAPPLLFTGLVSYSLYLWHLPVFGLFACYHLDDLGAAGLVALLAALYAIAALSWRFVERPVRTGAVLRSSRSFLITAGAVSAALLATGMVFWSSHGLPQRFAADEVPDPWPPPERVCEQRSPEQVAAGELCNYGPVTGEVQRVLVWGDSHAIALIPAYERLAASHHMHIYVAVRPSCRPLLGVSNIGIDPSQRERCWRFNAAVAAAISRIKPGLVILNARWIDEDAMLVPDPDLKRPLGASNFLASLEYTLRQVDAAGRSVCAVLDVPTLRYEAPRYLATARLFGRSASVLQLSRVEALRQFAGPERDFRSLERAGRLTTADPKDVLCPHETCAVVAGGRVLYGDSNHLSLAGTMLVVGTLERCFSAGPSGSLGDRSRAETSSGAGRQQP